MEHVSSRDPRKNLIHRAALETLESRRLLCGFHTEELIDARKNLELPEYQPVFDSAGAPEVDTGGLVWTNRGNDNFGAYGDKADAARQAVDAAFYFWNQVIGSFNQDGGNDQIDVTLNALARGTGVGGNGGVNTRIGTKPRTASVNLGGGSDTDENGTVDDAEGFYIDPTPYDFSEFQGDIINAFTGTATPGGPADGNEVWDLFSLTTVELQHAIGWDAWSELAWFKDTNDYIRPAGTSHATAADDVIDGVGKLYTFNGGGLQALLTSRNGGGDAGYPVHTARVGGSYTTGGITYQGQDDTGGGTYISARRYLPSYTSAQALGIMYGYVINPPQDVGQTVYAIPDRDNRQVLVRNTDFASNDLMEMRSSSGGIFITLNIGNDVVGTNLNGAFVVQFPRLAFDSVIMDGGGGNDILRVDGNDGAPVSLRGNAGVDTFDVSLLQVNLDLITGPVDISGGSDADSMRIYDNNDTTGDSTTFTYDTFDTTGLNLLTYSFVEAITYTAGTGGDNISVQSMSTPTTIHGNSGNDTITLGTGAFDANTISAAMSITGGLGADRLNIGSGNSDAVAAPVSWEGSGGGDSLVYNDTNPTYSINYDISNTGVNRDGINAPFLVSYANTQAITINGSAGSDTVSVRNGVAATITANGNNGNDNFIVGGGNLSGTFPQNFNGGAGTDQITFDDHLDTTNRIWDIRNNEVIFGGLISLFTTAFESVGVLAGTGNDEITFAGSISQALNIDGGSGANAFILGFQNSVTFLAPTTIVGGSNVDTFTVNDAAVVAFFGGSIQMDGGVGFNNVLTVNEPTPVAFTIGSNYFAMDGGFGTFGFANMNTAVFNGNANNNTYTVYSAGDAFGTWTLNGNLGNDSFLLAPQPSGYTFNNLTLNGNQGTDTYVYDATALSEANSYSVGTNFITRQIGGFGSETVSTSSMNSITLTCGGGDDSIFMGQYSSGIPVTINGGFGDDVCNFGGNDVAANITNIPAFLFNGNEGIDTFNLRNATPNNNFTYAIPGNTTLQVSRSVPSSYFISLEYYNTEQKHVYAGPAVDVMNITSFASGELSFHGGAGDDTMNLPTSSDFIGRRVNFFGDAGTLNRITQSSNTKNTPTTMHVYQNSIGAFPGDNFFAAGGSVHFDSVQTMALRMGTGADTAYIEPNPIARINLSGDLPFLPGDQLNLALAATTNPVFSGSGASGSMTSSDRATITYTGFEVGPTIDDIAPAVVFAEINLDGAPGFAEGLIRQSLDVQFSEDVSALLSADSLQLENLTIGQSIPTANIAVEYLAATNTARFTFPGYDNGVLPDGNYAGTILQSVPDAFGNPLSAAVNFEFFFLNGDANHDRAVNINDFAILASRFNLPGTFSQGDFDYNGVTNISDFALLASRFNTSLPAPANLPRQSGESLRPERGVFSQVAVEEDELVGLVG